MKNEDVALWRETKSKCKRMGCNMSLQVKSKANAICIDGCVKTGVVFGDLISSCEVVNSRSLQLQCTGFVPTVSIEKTDGVQLYVGKKVRTVSCFLLKCLM